MRGKWKDTKKNFSKTDKVTWGNYHKGPSSFKKFVRQVRRNKEKQALQKGLDYIPKASQIWYL